MTDASEREVRCPLCAHVFAPGALPGSVYCSRCGRRFNPASHLDETVAVPPPGSVEIDPVVEEETDAPARERIGDYDILSEIARGGMGVVYKARQRTLRRIVALKVLRGGDGASNEDLARFMREAKAAASLSHPNIVPIHELSVWNGRHFFTMDYVEGTPLDQLLERGPLTPNQACELIDVISRAIHYAHTHGIIHRDLKPGNIILDVGGRPMITDFGLAVNLEQGPQSRRMTRSGAVMGTIPYIPPEQAAGRIDEIDARSDVYSLGAVLYEMLTGEPPFTGQTQYELLRRVIHQEPVPPRKITPRIHPDVETICLRCLEKDPARRYPSAEELADDCLRFLDGEVIHARPVTLRYRAYKFAVRQRLPLAGLALTVMVVTALAANWYGSFLRTAELEDQLVRQKDQAETLALQTRRSERDLRRDWRQEFAADFTLPGGVTHSLDDAYRRRLIWHDRSRTRQENAPASLVMQNNADKATRAAVGVPVPFPLDAELYVRVRVPPGDAGSLTFLVGLDRSFKPVDGSYVITLGVPGRPGGRIERGGSVLVEQPQLVLTPDQWQDVRLTRLDGILSVTIDGEERMRATLPARQPENEASFFALSAVGGGVALERLTVSVRGMNRVMVTSMLEMAANLSLHRDFALALELYARVARENILPAREHMLALRGFARSLVLSRRRTMREIETECQKQVEKMRLSRWVPSGEAEYLTGLALQNMDGAAERQAALAAFDAAVKAATPASADLLSFGGWEAIGPFHAVWPAEFEIPFPPESEYAPRATYEGKHGPVGWEPIGDPAVQGEIHMFLSKAGAGNHDSVFFARRVYHCRERLPVTIYSGSDDGMVLWLNGTRLRTEAVQRGLLPDQDVTRAVFEPGENVLLMKIGNGPGSAGFQLRVEPYARAVMGRFGRLAQFEQALTYLRADDLVKGLQAFQQMQTGEVFGGREFDNALRVLAEKYPEEIRVGGTLSDVLSRIDRILDKGRPFDEVFGLLECLRTLYPDDGDELALRYYDLGRAMGRRKLYTRADAALQMAISLAPNWHPPRFDRAKLHFLRGETAEGERVLQEALDALPGNLDLHLAAAAFYLDDVDGKPRNLKRAVKAAGRAVEISGHLDVRSLRLLAQALALDDRPREALPVLQSVISLLDAPAPEDQALLDRLNQLVAPTVTSPDPYGRDGLSPYMYGDGLPVDPVTGPDNPPGAPAP